MKRNTDIFLKAVTAILLLMFAGAVRAQKKLTDYVHTLQGTASSFELSRGNTYPTVAMPWGMNFWTPQTGENGSGWIYTFDAREIRGLRQTHQCSPWTKDYAAFSIMPVSGELAVGQHDRAVSFSHENETAKPHYYGVTLDNQVRAEMSPTERGAFMRFTYPAGKKNYIVIDAQKGGSMVKILPQERKIIGYCRNTNHSTPGNFTNYFIITLDQDILSYGTWRTDGSVVLPGQVQEEGDHVGAYIEVAEGRQVSLKVASSFISPGQAERNLIRELGGAGSLEAIRNLAEQAWERQLGKIEVEGGTEEQKATFYSCFFRSMLFPRMFYELDDTGNPIYYSPYDGKIHKGYMYTDTGFWDAFRAQFPLNVLLHPSMHRRYIRSLLDAYDQSGWLPSWSFPGHNGGMIGNHAFSLLADAYAKGITDFDTRKALDAMYHDANNKAPFGASIGRPAARKYFNLGYVPHDRSRSAGREATAKTLEFAYNDFCAMVLAKKTGYRKMEGFFAQSVYNYKNVFNPATRFMEGRLADGSWKPNFDPTEWGDPFTEANAWHYTWSVFHDIQGLINLMGGKKNFVAKLDSVFTVPNTVNVGSYSKMIHEMAEMVLINMGQYAHGNQPAQHVPYLYTYAGQPWKTQARVREIMDRLYNAGPEGFCGDEDQGAMSAWYVISAMGLYAVTPGTDQYVVGSPLFPRMTLHLENGKKLVIEAESNAPGNVYIKSATLNNRHFSRNYLTHEELMQGGILKFKMSDKPNRKRGIRPKDYPFSMSGSF